MENKERCYSIFNMGISHRAIWNALGSVIGFSFSGFYG